MPEKTQNRLAEVKRLYEEAGLTLQQIGDLLGVTKQAVHSRLSRAKVQMRPRSVRRASFKRDLLDQLYTAEGLTLNEIGEKLGVSGTAVAREMKRHGIKRRRSGLPATTLEGDLIYQLYVTDGLTIAEIGAKLGVSVRVVGRELKRHEITFRHRHLPPSRNFDRDLLYKLYVLEGLSLNTISQSLGVSGRTISRELRRHGIDRRGPGRRRRV